MLRKIAALLALMLTAGLLVGIQAASAHECENEFDPKPEECTETRVYDDWRPNYVPLFDLADRDGEDGEQQRYDAQRWRDECHNNGEYRQQCLWFYGGQSLVPDPRTDGEPMDPIDGIFSRPNEFHFGYAATHCFLAEGAHDCDRHGQNEFDTHDSHGGAIYVDVCVSSNDNSKYCDEGLKDTQAGVTIVDHLACPTGCFDEYHVVRPFDQEYTNKQTENSISATDRILHDPQRHICGYQDKGSRC